MNILITQRHSVNKHGDWIDSLENKYIEFFGTFGINLIPVPNISKNIDKFVKTMNIHGVVLSGGGDVDPELFGGSAKGCAISKERDKCESKLLEAAVSMNIPVFGICRGMQYINVHFGGKLLNNISSIDIEGKHKIAGSHSVRIIADGLEFSLGNNVGFQTNSYHEHGLIKKGLGEDIRPFAVYDDLGLIEGIYHSRYPIAGVQWHPERDLAPASLDKVLIEGFMKRKLFWSKA
jgi:putative glutamine amidotransferase